MRKIFLCLAVVGMLMPAMAQKVTSPNGKLSLETAGEGLRLCYQNQPVLDIPAVGFEGVSCKPALTFVRKVKADYCMLAGKRLHAVNEANEYETTLGKGGRMVVRLYNDGLAFRYELSQLSGVLPKEKTTYRIPEGTKRWIQQWTDAYEGFFPLTTSYKTQPVRSFSGTFKSADGWNIRWGYPALLEPRDGVFALISEANIERLQSASCLYNDGELYRVTPDANTLHVSDDWYTPWRVAIVGGLADIVESTLVTDVSEPCRLTDTSWIHPGVVSWIYWAYNHGSDDYNIICKYIDMAATLHLPYMLIDAEWDRMKDGKTVEDAVNYAKEKGVDLLAGVPHAGADEANVLDAGELGVEAAAQFKERGAPPRHETASRGRLGNAGENFEKRGLSGAIAADDADKCSLGYGKGDVAERGERDTPASPKQGGA